MTKILIPLLLALSAFACTPQQQATWNAYQQARLNALANSQMLPAPVTAPRTVNSYGTIYGPGGQMYQYQGTSY